RARCLLTELPIPAHSNSFYRITPRQQSVLQICLPDELEIGDVWPWTRWDDQDQVFFSTEEPDSGCGSARIRGYLGQQPGARHRRIGIDIECIFYALGWSEGDFSPRFTIIDPR